VQTCLVLRRDGIKISASSGTTIKAVSVTGLQRSQLTGRCDMDFSLCFHHKFRRANMSRGNGRVGSNVPKNYHSADPSAERLSS